MYLHLGNDIAVSSKDVIGVFDIENTTITKQGRKFLTAAQKEQRVIYATQDLPKSYIVIQDGEGVKVYISSISPSTLLKRANYNGVLAAGETE